MTPWFRLVSCLFSLGFCSSRQEPNAGVKKVFPSFVILGLVSQRTGFDSQKKARPLRDRAIFCRQKAYWFI